MVLAGCAGLAKKTRCHSEKAGNNEALGSDLSKTGHVACCHSLRNCPSEARQNLPGVQRRKEKARWGHPSCESLLPIKAGTEVT